MVPSTPFGSLAGHKSLRCINNKMLKFLSRNAFKKFMHTMMVRRVKIA